MSGKDTGQSKTEQATPQKLKKAKQEGQVPRSKDLASSALIISCSILLTTTADWIAAKVAKMARSNMIMTKAQLDEPGMMARHLAQALLEVLNFSGHFFNGRSSRYDCRRDAWRASIEL